MDMVNRVEWPIYDHTMASGKFQKADWLTMY